MGLADYKPKREQITFSGGSFSVRGLGLDDFAVLINEHLADMDSLFDLYDEASRQDARVAEIARFAIVLAREAPALTANVIALASDEPDTVEQARRLSLPVQVNALKAIGTLTFEEAGGFRKFAESLTSLLTAIRPTVMKTDSPT